MKKRRKPELAMLFIMMITVMILTACANQTQTESSAPTEVETVAVTEAPTEAETVPLAEDFSCYILDQNGENLYGYRREIDGVWYLFVPSTQDISDLVLYYDGEVAETSAGELDKESSTIVNAFSNAGDQIELTTEKGNVFNIVVMQSDLPSVQIYLKGTTLDTIHQDKDEKYKGNTVIITDPNGENDLTATESVEMKGRGNSSWRLYDKKGYQIKFDEKTSVLGMGKAKKWVLLANASDDSMIRTQLVYHMAKKLDMAFVPSFEYVDLWVDGDYLGTYILGEKVEIGGSRLNLEEDTAALFEHDEAFYDEEDYWFYSRVLQRHFVLKEIAVEEESVIEAAMKDFEKSVNELADYLYSTSSMDSTLDELSTMIDVDSFAKYYLINEYVLNRESFATSFYWYKDGPEDVIHLGPIWDFDTCMGNDGSAVTDTYGENHILFRHLLTIPEFRKRTEELYAEYQEVFASMSAEVEVLKAEIGNSAEMNFLRWNVLGTGNPKDGAEIFRNTYEEAVTAVETWLKGREENFAIPKTSVVSTEVSEDCSTLTITFNGEIDQKKVQFAVWNLEVEPQTVQWFKAKQKDGVWTATVNLAKFNSAGLYRIDLYAGDEKEARATGCAYVETAVKN